MNISDEVVEAAALAVFLQAYERADWDLITNQIKARYIRDAKRGLEAVVPHLMAHAWEEGRRDGWEESRSGYENAFNPYCSAGAGE
jgi:hypothetical protein